MDVQTKQSEQIEDHRDGAGWIAWVTHGGAAVLAAVATLIGLHVAAPPAPPTDRDWQLVETVSTAIDRGDDYWAPIVAKAHTWRAPHVVLISSKTGEATLCGMANSTTGPFYCPGNERIYLDLAFVRSIGGDLGRAYVIAHELGHHVQKLLGLMDKPRPQTEIELQADCFAGAWIASEQSGGHLAVGDIDAALAEASAVGDDRICPGCSPEQWTHGSSAQRVDALKRGISHLSCE